MSTDNRYVVGHTINTPGRDEPSVGVIPVVYTLRDAIEVCQEERARVLPVGVEFHIYRLEPVPGYIEDVDLAAGPGWGGENPEQREAFDRYLESSEALGDNHPIHDCSCGHRPDLHLHRPESWGECDVDGCSCLMYRNRTVDR